MQGGRCEGMRRVGESGGEGGGKGAGSGVHAGVFTHHSDTLEARNQTGPKMQMCP